MARCIVGADWARLPAAAGFLAGVGVWKSLLNDAAELLLAAAAAEVDAPAVVIVVAAVADV